MLTFVDGLMI